MNAYLLIDFGSTYTKLSLVDIDRKKLVKRVSSNTTVKTNIKVGYDLALEKLKDSVNMDEVNIVDTLACSSAGGGLKMVSIGITPNFTVEASKRAALGAGARLLKSYSYRLSLEDIKEIDDLSPDIILLTGGAEDGNKSYIIHNAKMLTQLNSNIPIVVAGNSYAAEEVDLILKDSNLEYEITENVMPDINRINADPVREIIRQIFMRQIMVAKGMEDVEKITSEILMPTPTAVLKATELLSKGTENHKGLGEIVVVDIGGATTDIHSVSEPIKDKNFFYDGLEEPYLKRTVEGDLGMRYSAISLYESVGEEGFKKFNPNIDKIYDRCKFRHDNPEVLLESCDEREFDEIMAKNCVELSIRRHCGSIRESYMNGRTVILQKGKDLRKISMVIGTGGVIINSKDAKCILKQVKNGDEKKLLPENPDFYLDKEYILSSMGLLSMRDSDLAFEILTENIKKL
ncbi:methylaspartate mutase accessory protein GlmL [Anaerosphaera multitolerans]|uniref:DNA mismatch repair protein MutL n=1 Tax=Anaerosphaera multitolerans TaxID=2487351 RepID=A0A437S9D9_9FIRM|nr:methylaspartate mutase accessory protein GlmL [Anaerosphaera multitolerans]RVU55612.1 DNA mismatch repair protein MutL [Anaerosphaera multitolerans]